MIIDFLYASIIGWLILFFFWLFILVFTFIRKAPQSNLTKKMVINSLIIFAIGFGILAFFLISIRFS